MCSQYRQAHFLVSKCTTDAFASAPQSRPRYGSLERSTDHYMDLREPGIGNGGNGRQEKGRQTKEGGSKLLVTTLLSAMQTDILAVRT